MSEMISLESAEFNLQEKTDGTPDRRGRRDETPFRILLLGNFGGRERRSLHDGAQNTSLAARRPRAIDRDNFDEVITALGVEAQINLVDGGKFFTFDFNELEDFHPDRIFERSVLFEHLRETRRQLHHPQTFAAAAAEVKRWSPRRWQKPVTPDAARDDEAAPSQETSALPADGASVLDQMLDEAERKTTSHHERKQGLSADNELNSFVHRVVAPHLAPQIDSQRDELIADVDAATTEIMRAILHHPNFQSLEAAWRALHFLTSRLETGVELKIYLLDLSREELIADLMTTDNLRTTELYQLLIERPRGGEPWSVIAGDYTFDLTKETEAELLTRLGIIARQAGTPFLSAAHNNVLRAEDNEHTEEVTEVWEALRGSIVAPYIGLALPRFLLRLPYGKETDEIEEFDFAEVDGDHESYLWGNPGFVCAYLLGQSFNLNGWKMRPGDALDVEDLPLHFINDDDEMRAKPCAEVLLTESKATKIMERGLMPLISYLNGDRIRLAGFQSIADPPAALTGPWD